MPYAIYHDEYQYQDGKGHERTMSPMWFVRLGLGIFWECTTKSDEARSFARRAEAVKMLKGCGKDRQGWRVVPA